MKLNCYTFPTPEENLACDEALLDACEAGECGEVLRTWSAAYYFVVVGYANEVAREVNREYCLRNRIPILRRCSGGGTVLQGPGCLNYSLFLEIEKRSETCGISATNHFVMERQRDILRRFLGPTVSVRGHTDLALGELKFSGNAQRRRRRFLVFHGTLLLQMDLGKIAAALPLPSKEPDYRLGRAHGVFLTNVAVPADALQSALAEGWGADEPLDVLPLSRITALVRDKYSLPEWNFKF